MKSGQPRFLNPADAKHASGSPPVTPSAKPFGEAATTAAGDGSGVVLAASLQDPAGSAYTPVTPYLLGSGSIGANVEYTNQAVAGYGSVPAGATAVAMTVTVTNPTASGYFFASKNGAAVTDDALVGFVAGTGSTTNTAIVPLDSSGKFEDKNVSSATIKISLTVLGYYSLSSTGYGYVPLTPSRLVDTRSAYNIGTPKTVGPIASGGSFYFEVTGAPTTATAIAVDLDTANTTGATTIELYKPGSSVKPAALSIGDGSTAAFTQVIPGACPGGVTGVLCISVTNAGPSAADLIVDMEGYFTTGGPNTDNYTPVTATLVNDTQSYQNYVHGFAHIYTQTAQAFQVTGRLGGTQLGGSNAYVNVPANASSVALEVQGISMPSLGNLRIYPMPASGNCAPPTDTQTLGYPSSSSGYYYITDMALATVGPTGSICLWNDMGTVNDYVDIAIYVVLLHACQPRVVVANGRTQTNSYDDPKPWPVPPAA
jgi:hypothetical protein